MCVDEATGYQQRVGQVAFVPSTQIQELGTRDSGWNFQKIRLDVVNKEQRIPETKAFEKASDANITAEEQIAFGGLSLTAI